eukprot:CAMPEP_0178519112 /NCGR_PEP_ID=MMETSP0696-20121128/26650_1 /TAXON_ID=265572 /ORGANISM="Extubocellulus spinifer, Strain CCMP396" /LENGTH=186 /DNA_ID=CAMNT_0020149787 /DNA_START=27 /DNA_END=584 /DNA_ORIENTATION=-
MALSSKVSPTQANNDATLDVPAVMSDLVDPSYRWLKEDKDKDAEKAAKEAEKAAKEKAKEAEKAAKEKAEEAEKAQKELEKAKEEAAKEANTINNRVAGKQGGGGGGGATTTTLTESPYSTGGLPSYGVALIAAAVMITLFAAFVLVKHKANGTGDGTSKPNAIGTWIKNKREAMKKKKQTADTSE